MLMCYEVTRDLPIDYVEIETPMARMRAPRIAGKKLVFAPILRAGMTLRRRHARARPGGARRPYRALSRPRHPGGGGIFLQGAARYRGAPGHRHLAGDRDRQHRGGGGRPHQGARRPRHSIRLPDHGADGDRTAARHPSRRAGSGRRRSTSVSTTRPSSFRGSAMPGTALLEQNKQDRPGSITATARLRSNGHTRSAA